MSNSNQLKVVAIIPARQGSKSIPHKNIRSLAGKPLLAYSIEHALSSKRINRTIVSTDSTYYGDIAQSYGAEVPFLRPAEIAQDDSTDLEVFQHALQWLYKHQNYEPDICVHLRPTSPVRTVADIDAMIKILEDDLSLDSVRSVAENIETPFKMWFRQSDGLLQPIIHSNIKEAYNQPRQKLPTTYLQNASIDVVRATTITHKNSMTGERIYGYVMQGNYDIDYEHQLDKVICELSLSVKDNTEAKTFCFDIDGVVACLTPDNDYNKADLNMHIIEMINKLYDMGHYIILFTARGTKTGLDWRSCTEGQLQKWGVKHHKLIFGKPAADFYIDDRMLSIDQLKKIINQ